MTGQVGGRIIIVGKQFDNGSYGGKTEPVEISWGLLGAPYEGAIRTTVKRYNRAGWLCMARKESEGMLGFGAHSTLRFEKSPQARRHQAPVKKQSCLLATPVWPVRLAALAVVAYFVLMLIASSG